MAGEENNQTDITGVHGGSNTYNSIIYQSFEDSPKDRASGNYSDTSKSGEIVDVVSDYPWNIDGMLTSNGRIVHVPHCYAIEYQQRYSSSMTNLINSLVAGVTASKNLGSTLASATENLTKFLGNLVSADVTGTVQSVKDSTTSAISNLTPNVIGDMINGIKSTFGNGINTIKNPLRGNDTRHYLQPYSLLYDMTSTGLKYCFPMISNPPTFKVSNAYVDS